MGAGEYKQNVHASGCYSRQIISLWGAVAAFILSLSIRFYTTYFTKSALRQPKAFSFFS